MIKHILTLLIGLISLNALADVELPLMFSNGMVMQRDQAIPVWGWAKPGENIEVHFKAQNIKTQADEHGKWRVTLNPEKHGGPFTLTVKGNNTIKIENVLVGEVWIASGQSNMEWAMSNIQNADVEQKDSNYPEIRQFLVPSEMSTVPKDRLTEGQWKESNPENIGEFTAVGFMFAKKLYQELGVPIGIINTTWGGTCVETWTSKDALEEVPEFAHFMSNLPNLDIDSMLKIQKQKLIGTVEMLQGQKLLNDNPSEVIKSVYDDSSWPEMNLPELWENRMLPNLDGEVWFRKTFNIDSDLAGKEALLHLSKIDDDDITYLNGIEVGTTSGYDVSRVYKIPTGILKSGENTITVKVTDYIGGGGIYGSPSDLKLTVEGSDISLAGLWKFNVAEVVTQFSPNSFPSLLYNAMVNPLIPYAVKGVIWYQGEANVHRAVEYKKSFPLMIENWRNKWGEGAFPFYFVQLSSFNEFNGNSNVGSKWAELREAQAYTVENVKNTEMCVTVDIGNPKDIHPRNKQDVGLRLAAIALNKDYEKKVTYQGPTFKSHTIKGNQVVLSFEHVKDGFKVKDEQGIPKGFEVAGADKKFVTAQVEIKNGKLLISNDSISNPVAVRYGWADDASACNVYNKAGFPMEPFRTDDWELSTAKESYMISDLK
ncbi:sialate O-acetylesterase [Mangrovimonas futianensis]|uniref:sialate O-acetylesterase n=1 Tax=Mangrovimonas futianensis TaxID=2895523 RepID=UPI001E587E1E|nr:sialate O-acetylesterase [Mangrovimonas futianensis]MCF1422867.1 hypothetical protein [Mangrovimonas futianensis]